jgi:hypothetical protein
MKTYGGVCVEILVFLTSALAGDEWSASRPVSPRANLNDVEKLKCLPLPGLELRLLGLPAGSQSLYRLRYPRSLMEVRDGDRTVILK